MLKVETPSQHGHAPRTQREVLRVTGLSKAYPGVQALSDVALTLASGEVRALLGKNGAGKSTLVKILSGAIQPDTGEIVLAGQAVTLPNPLAARRLGIATVHQELSLVPELTVGDNVLLGRWTDEAKRGPFISNRGIADYAQTYLDQLEVGLDARTKVRHLSVAQQQTVEIARAVSLGSKVLILDEPTSSLPAAEVANLIGLIRRLAASGMAIIYVSHRMDEIPRVADSVTVFRDGRHIATTPIADAGTRTIVELMTGHAPKGASRRGASSATHEPVLQVDQLGSGDRLADVSLTLHRGEVVGIAGLLGSGRTELLRCLYGLDPIDAGTIVLEGRPFTPRKPRDAIRAGLGFAPEERKRDGLALDMSVAGNLVLASLRRIGRFGVLSGQKERELATDNCRRLAIKTPSTGVAVRTLSGGNQQKVILGKWLNARARVLLLDEPTRGVDVEAKEQIYALVRQLAAHGTSVLFVSSEADELFLVCDRLVVLNAGRTGATLDPASSSAAEVTALAMQGVPT